MDVVKIMKLVDAGFTREEILKFAGENPVDKVVDKPVDNTVDKVVDKPVDKHVDKVVDKSTESEALGEILQEMKNVVLEIQKANIFRASLPGPGDGDNVDSILASIINPRKENN